MLDNKLDIGLIIYLCWISSSKTWYWAWVWAWYRARAWLMNQAELKLLYFITSSNLNIICKLVSSSSQVWIFYFCCWAEIEHHCNHLITIILQSIAMTNIKLIYHCNNLISIILQFIAMTNIKQLFLTTNISLQ